MNLLNHYWNYGLANRCIESHSCRKHSTTNKTNTSWKSIASSLLITITCNLLPLLGLYIVYLYLVRFCLLSVELLITEHATILITPPREWCGILWSTRLSVCVSVRQHLWNRETNWHEILCADSLWPWLGPSLAALRYVMHFRFYGWRHSLAAVSRMS